MNMQTPGSLAAALADPLTPQLYAAAKAEVGVVVRVSDQRLALGRLPYLVKVLADPELYGLLFRASPETPREVWIIKPEAVSPGQGEVPGQEP